MYWLAHLAAGLLGGAATSWACVHRCLSPSISLSTPVPFFFLLVTTTTSCTSSTATLHYNVLKIQLDHQQGHPYYVLLATASASSMLCYFLVAKMPEGVAEVLVHGRLAPCEHLVTMMKGGLLWPTLPHLQQLSEFDSVS